MAVLKDMSYIGKGGIYIGAITNGVPGALISVGNSSKLSLAVSEDTKQLLDYTSAGGGTRNQITRIKGIEASITLLDFSPDNLAMALRGTSGAIATGAVSSETIVGYKNALVPFAFLPDTSATITVKNSARRHYIR